MEGFFVLLSFERTEARHLLLIKVGLRFEKILSKKNGEKQTGGKNEKKKKVIDIVREKHLQSQKTKNSFRPGGRSAGWNNSANIRSGSGNNSRGTGRGGRG